jgi:hypothetical protein
MLNFEGQETQLEDAGKGNNFGGKAARVVYFGKLHCWANGEYPGEHEAPSGARNARDFVTALALWLANLDRFFPLRALLQACFQHAFAATTFSVAIACGHWCCPAGHDPFGPVGMTTPKGRVYGHPAGGNEDKLKGFERALDHPRRRHV